MLSSVKRRVHSRLQRLILFASDLNAAALNRFMPDSTAYDVFYKHGFHLLRRSYYLPIPEEEELSDEFWDERSELVGVEMNEKVAIGFLNDVFTPYVEEFRGLFPIHQEPGSTEPFYLINGTFMAVDAHVYYAFIRHFRPRRIVEIGSGFSTMVAAAAGMRNGKEGVTAPHLVAVDPFPPANLKEGFPGLSEVVEARVQDVGLDLFTSLQTGDVLFIDSTHALKAGGDVQFEYCEILPRLQPGVLVHVHDISLPKPYPRAYFDNHVYWNEQYVLQAFLAFNSRFEVLWPGNYMMLNHPEKMTAAFPEYHAMRRSFPQSEPASFWMRVKPPEEG
jgi:hypothetical protein